MSAEGEETPPPAEPEKEEEEEPPPMGVKERRAWLAKMADNAQSKQQGLVVNKRPWQKKKDPVAETPTATTDNKAEATPAAGEELPEAESTPEEKAAAEPAPESEPGNITLPIEAEAPRAEPEPIIEEAVPVSPIEFAESTPEAEVETTVADPTLDEAKSEVSPDESAGASHPLGGASVESPLESETPADAAGSVEEEVVEDDEMEDEIIDEEEIIEEEIVEDEEIIDDDEEEEVVVDDSAGDTRPDSSEFEEVMENTDNSYEEIEDDANALPESSEFEEVVETTDNSYDEIVDDGDDAEREPEPEEPEGQAQPSVSMSASTSESPDSDVAKSEAPVPAPAPVAYSEPLAQASVESPVPAPLPYEEKDQQASLAPVPAPMPTSVTGDGEEKAELEVEEEEAEEEEEEVVFEEEDVPIDPNNIEEEIVFETVDEDGNIIEEEIEYVDEQGNAVEEEVEEIMEDEEQPAKVVVPAVASGAAPDVENQVAVYQQPVVMQQPKSKQEVQADNAIYSCLCLLFLLLVTAVVLLLLRFVFDVDFGQNNDPDFIGEEPTTPMDPYVPGDCNFSGQAQPHVLSQCRCNEEVSIFADDTLAKYELLRDQWVVPNVYTSWNLPVQSCEAANQALVWLASGNAEDNTDLLQRYVMAFLYFSTEGTEWDNQENWISDQNVCDWYGVECPDQRLINFVNINDNSLVGPVSIFICVVCGPVNC